MEQILNYSSDSGSWNKNSEYLIMNNYINRKQEEHKESQNIESCKNNEKDEELNDIQDLVEAEGLAAYNDVDITDMQRDLERK